MSASGAGLENAKVGELSEFRVDCSRAGRAELAVEVIQADGTKCKVDMKTIDGMDLLCFFEYVFEYIYRNMTKLQYCTV